MRMLLVTLLLAVTALGQEKAPAGQEKAPAPAAPTPAQGPPPRNLTKLPDGHFSANSDPKNPENFELRVVMRGDTLWAVAQEVLKDGRLWPQIWEQNEHIVNPHWIYPNDKILIRPVTRISDAKPPEAEAPAAAAEPAKDTTPQPLKGKLVAAPYPGLPPIAPPVVITNLAPPRTFPEVKDSDLYCSGFIRTEPVPAELKVVARYHDEQELANAGDYIYIGKGAEGGVNPGATYQVLRPTKTVTSSKGKGASNLGTHYLEVAQVQVVVSQPDHSLGRVSQGCEAVELGDLLVPYNKIDFPALPSKRPFSGTMKGSGQVPGNIVMTKDTLANSGSSYGTGASVPRAPWGSLKTLDRGVVSEGGVVYVDVGKREGVKAGDFFIVFRDVELRDGSALKGQKARSAIAELVIIKVEDLASTALVTYSADAISLGDVVERR